MADTSPVIETYQNFITKIAKDKDGDTITVASAPCVTGGVETGWISSLTQALRESATRTDVDAPSEDVAKQLTYYLGTECNMYETMSKFYKRTGLRVVIFIQHAGDNPFGGQESMNKHTRRLSGFDDLHMFCSSSAFPDSPDNQPRNLIFFMVRSGGSDCQYHTVFWNATNNGVQFKRGYAIDEHLGALGIAGSASGIRSQMLDSIYTPTAGAES